MTLQPRISLKDKKYDSCIFLAILLVLSLFMTCWPGPLPTYAGHDYYFNFMRFETLMSALKEGNYPYYIDYNILDGYGYFVKAFYPDLTLVPFAFIGLYTEAGFAYSFMIFTMTFLCGWFMYLAVKSIFRNRIAAAFSSILYTFSVYHFFDWYNRGALGEAISFTFLPVIFLGLYHIIAGNYKKWYLLTIGYSLLIYTHLLSSFLTLLVMVICLLLCGKKMIKQPVRIAYLLVATLVTIPVVASYIFPMMEQMMANSYHYSLQENITGQTKQNLVQIGWGFLSGLLYPKDENLTGTGPLLILLLLLRFFLIRKKPEYIRIADFCLAMGIICLLALSSLIPWGRLPFGFVQFPWRLYEFVVFFFAIAGAYYLFVLLKSRKQLIIASAVIVSFTIISIVIADHNYKNRQLALKDYEPQWLTGIPSVENDYYQGGFEYLPQKVSSFRYIHQRGKDSVSTQQDHTRLHNFVNKNGHISVDLSIISPDILELPLIYYKGYIATLQIVKYDIPIKESDNGLIQVEVIQSSTLQVYYNGTIVQRISWYVSLLSMVLLAIYVLYKRRKDAN
ncbi:hypothetical protein [Dysgonomonas sp. 511]|uniref:hypothetical protein n=1 Tax=Dysgonomonas sp. 511 TaxID=2302930 RepID=UPI0013D2B4AE|nr:hypothetical protein [Dysgonomonas sp. 511]NDV78367.1 hypothetical protein [Dysgonomonas sp. 511]